LVILKLKYLRPKKLNVMIKETVKTRKGLVQQMRVIPDQINIDIQDMSLEQELEYLKKMQRDKSPKKKELNEHSLLS
jgi:hypothetical protein